MRPFPFLYIFKFYQFFQLIDCLGHKDWTNSAYPDIRGPTFQAKKISKLINDELAKVAIGTPCPCQRRSQCSSGYSTSSGSTFHGFIVSIALVDNLQMNFHSPSEQQLTDRAESFCKALEGRWALGDCGNSVIVFVWRHYKKLIIWPARLAERYITHGERKAILARVNDLVQNDRWSDAIAQVIAEMYEQLRGEPESRVDTGTLSLIIAVGVASLITSLITGCVCAFRCCGNLSPDEKSGSVLVDSSASFSLPPMNCQLPITSTALHSSHQQISRMPSSPSAIRRSPTPPPQPSQLSYMAFSDTTIV
uniref:Uncharacterized protein n=3 Tax=Meloidogyne TaxID=189290 RepID=A0A914KV40_MELIC